LHSCDESPPVAFTGTLINSDDQLLATPLDALDEFEPQGEDENGELDELDLTGEGQYDTTMNMLANNTGDENLAPVESYSAAVALALIWRRLLGKLNLFYRTCKMMLDTLDSRLTGRLGLLF